MSAEEFVIRTLWFSSFHLPHPNRIVSNYKLGILQSLLSSIDHQQVHAYIHSSLGGAWDCPGLLTVNTFGESSTRGEADSSTDANTRRTFLALNAVNIWKVRQSLFIFSRQISLVFSLLIPQFTEVFVVNIQKICRLNIDYED